MLHHKIIGQGQPLIILHGLFGMLDNWMTLAKRYGEFYEVHLIDQRNHGHSFHDNEHSYEAMAGDLKDYIESQKLESVILLGHSMGGKTAMLAACLYPNLIEKLIVVDISPKFYAPHHQSIIEGLYAVKNADIKSRKEADVVLSKHFDNAGIRMFLLKNLFWKTKTQLDFRFNLDAIVNQIEKIGVALDDELSFENPTLFIDGEKSDYILESDLGKIEEHFPDSEVVEISNAGHWVHAENPNDFWDATMQFIRFS